MALFSVFDFTFFSWSTIFWFKSLSPVILTFPISKLILFLTLYSGVYPQLAMKIKITGDRDLNQNIINQLKNLKSKNENSPEIYDLTINTKMEKIVTSKDSKGNPKTYKMISTINLATIKDGKKYDIDLESVENYNDISSKFELENFEKNLKKNSASKITQEIILYLITL